ncbi:MAG: protein containing C-terminal region/beta chain of methionyl-tRNA synthetase [Acidobacteria bacterium]|nr:protein containing C-terminal region/beta chain of methionyl-tRNA synthetase [Acidobacteriota bacterium]
MCEEKPKDTSIEPAAAPAAQDSRIPIEDFARVEMRVGQVVEAQKVEGSRKLVKMKVDIGSEIRQVVAGIAEAYDPAVLVNKKVVLVVNLKPARIMGIESNGMIVAASDGARPVLATFTEEVRNGSLLR